MRATSPIHEMCSNLSEKISEGDMATKKKSGKRPTRGAKPRVKAKARSKRAPARKPTKKLVDRRKPETPRFQGASPGFTVNDVEKSLAFYRDVLGFVVKDRYERDGKLQGAELVAGDAHFFVGQDDW